MSFDFPNHFLNIRESIGTPTPNVGVPLGMCVSLEEKQTFSTIPCDYFLVAGNIYN